MSYKIYSKLAFNVHLISTQLLRSYHLIVRNMFFACWELNKIITYLKLISEKVNWINNSQKFKRVHKHKRTQSWLNIIAAIGYISDNLNFPSMHIHDRVCLLVRLYISGCKICMYMWHCIITLVFKHDR